MATTEGQSHSLRSVAILRPGSYRDMQGRSVRFTDEELRRIAAGYDPQYHLATLNLDHSDSGPALGSITALRYENGLLLADISGLPHWLATQLSEGRWPARSAEVWRELDGRGPYLRGLALLGARAPAVRGLPALPQPILAADTGNGLINVFMEEQMDSGNGVQQEAELARLTEENRWLGTQLGELRRREEEARVDALIDELRREGRITPGMERSGLRELLVSLGTRQGDALQLADGSELSTAQCLEGLLRSLPALQLSDELAAGEDGPKVAMSDFEREIAGSLGLSDTEFAGIRDARAGGED